VNSLLEHRLKRLMLARVVMATTLLLVAVYVEAVSETLLPVNPLYFLIAATYALTVAYALALKGLPRPDVQAHVQLVLDLLLITGLVYLTGGTASQAGFMLLYPISVLSGSVLLYRRRALLLAAVAMVFYAGMLLSVRTGVVRPPYLSTLPVMPLKQVLYSIFVTGVSCATVALIGSYLSESLKRAGEELVEAAEQVADLRELYELVVNSIHSGLVTADAAGRVLYINAFGEQLLGQRGPHLRGKTLRDVFASVELEVPAIRVRAQDERLARVEFMYTTPQGRDLDLGLSVAPLATADPLQGGFLLVFQNLTRIKQLEREVRMKEKLAAVGEMAAYLTHEIRNPLGSISGSAQVLLQEPGISSDQQHLLAIIVKESKRLSESLNQFLVEARTAPGDPGPVDLGPVVSDLVTLLRNSPEVGAAHAVELEADEGPHVCLADRDQIVQVFWNLARNGLEAMPAGGLLKVRLAQRDGEIVLSFRDQGRGMDRDEQRRLFEPFHSGKPTGTGLGLALAFRLIREHRGDIKVRSRPQMGTEVEVRLPLVEVATARALS
jgi:two-component system, NtrC family, sensor histidine kinase PilS